VPGDTNGTRDAFVHDRQTGTTERVSVASDGTQGNGFSNPDSINGDGRFVVFSSFASNLVQADTNQQIDVFVRDRQARTTQRVSISGTNQQADGSSTRADISADGRFVVFTSAATNLVAGDVNGTDDVFVRDLQAGTTQRVSVSSSGAEANGRSPSNGIRGGIRFGPAINADGRFVVFDSQATNLVPGDTNTCSQQGAYSFTVLGSCPDVFVHDRQAGTTQRVSIDTAGVQANDASTDPAINGDGSVVAFFSAASNLVAGDTNFCTVGVVSFGGGHCPDIFAHTG
jgi:hypothetical protein